MENEREESKENSDNKETEEKNANNSTIVKNPGMFKLQLPQKISNENHYTEKIVILKDEIIKTPNSQNSITAEPTRPMVNHYKTNETKEHIINTTVTFEELVLQTISRGDQNTPIKKKRIGRGAEVITHKEAIARIKKEKETKLAKSVNKKKNTTATTNIRKRSTKNKENKKSKKKTKKIDKVETSNSDIEMSTHSDSDLLDLKSDIENEAIIMECIENRELEGSQIVTNMIGQIDLEKFESSPKIGGQKNKKMMVNNIDDEQYVRGQGMKENHEEILINMQPKEVLGDQDIQDMYDEADGGIYLDETKESCFIEVKNEKKAERKDIKQVKKNEKPRTIKVSMLSEVRDTADNHPFLVFNKYDPPKSTEKYTHSVLRDQNFNTPNQKIQNSILDDYFAAGCSKESEKNTCVSYDINDCIIVRYIFKKKVKYFVGKIISKLGNKYEVSFYVQHGKNDSTIFRKPKKMDIDTIDEEMIVKPVQLIALNQQELDFAFFEDDDLVYFDC